MILLVDWLAWQDGWTDWMDSHRWFVEHWQSQSKKCYTKVFFLVFCFPSSRSLSVGCLCALFSFLQCFRFSFLFFGLIGMFILFCSAWLENSTPVGGLFFVLWWLLVAGCSAWKRSGTLP
ncbi:hypothetical protein B0T22DRAFT_248622 [Podospora appendiculata]|uniref:Uncharacterized protein n=1 Tax=Podospora appendiculata TaxID=314037 RepID=A0AAE1C8X7_9PEZI|nr:hypothetical protein B0T22DRAFT_248622 [Podospora appendiculata]